MNKSYSAEKYEVLFAEKEPKWQDAIRRDVSFQRTKVYRCGDMLEIECFPVWSTKRMRDAAEQAIREMKNREAINRRQRERRQKDEFRRLLENNFDERDMFLTLTYDYGILNYDAVDKQDLRRRIDALPQSAEDARRDLRNYIQRLRRWMVKQGMDPRALKYLYVVESGKEPREDDPLPTIQKFHHHVVISGVPREVAEQLWLMGYANSRSLQPNENGLEGLAKYMTKQRKFAHSWAGSKNLIRPVPTVSDRAISRRRVAKIAADVKRDGRAILQQLYPGYYAAEAPTVKYSEFVSGAYIYARMRRIRSEVKACRPRN